MSAINLVHDIANKDKNMFPFQLDFCLIFPETQFTSIMIPEDEQDDDDDDDEDEESTDYTYKYKDRFGNIKKKLSSEKLKGKISPINPDDDKLKDLFNEFSRNKFKSSTQYPKNRRFCILIDRRKPGEEDYGIIEDDECLIFDPPSNCNKIPKNVVPLWFLDSSATCIIPGIGYDNETGDNKWQQGRYGVTKYETYDPQEVITSKSVMSGALMVFSFIVQAKDFIKCYMYLNGQFCRFFPNYMMDLLPNYFSKSIHQNDSFAKSEDLKQMINDVNKRLRDGQFESFYNKYGASDNSFC